ncbi:UDP-N-acetylmuramoyl-tripeptide--D-alanyl-D-alanine ligase [Veillonella caviae]|uniref:UDP-N-acetylmuramoyl-tripeptide--D-alanyl-D- alanine ligase n=2 Tax=Veillonella caviae TaxID=248316 RepID=UPI0023A8FF9B|nr:UDP-N-acetylmuramoyl-tripeptide--D-alanyl-D-alanine ligase [Veillonella caviae]MCI5709039.1 UDP-N-acetylmuramoyl-tripeptide--D-alanyl-D-alanine ligase [Veillonella caviae]MDD7291081.1 UDP-N-acetylmuramoyl-tripeptide--D-alanyl-D-alanine ligase [Veillonella caviae]MDY4746737.1 UDP-N-acetylmuramoyl-tripeptide--D-alanyl-D-alanine ligase [Veillonella caviae]MDY5409410.1 UDP-N-acetylmuramoyl-tripeptide--D-alanyl-D-alanine ligase [Veillonella caviae]MDY5715246.1 UDP-N-acetylmuramoyl-tripeptide--D-
MAQFTVQDILQATGGTCTGDNSIQFADVSTDTRTIEADYLFVALRGDTFDGHDFIKTAIEKGATGAIVENGHSVEGILCIEVENTLKAYQDLANFHRHRFNIPIVAITGSSGKTTTKEMVAAVLSTEFNVLKTEKNFNNEIGLPKTLLQLTNEHEACVVEMGMRGLGQIEELALIAEPTIGIITNVGTSHIELLGSKEAIGEAKGELIRCLGTDSISILNEDDSFVSAMSAIAKGKTMTYGIHSNATIKGSHLRYKKDGIKFTCKAYDDVFDVFLPMIGEHNVYDALAAIAAGRALGVKPSKIKKGLSEFTGTPMRQEIVAFDDIVILNDAYNANPSSMSEAIKALGQLDGKRKIAMLGDMLELGDFTEEGHRQIGRLLGEEKYSVLFTFGDAADFIAKEAKLMGLEVHRCNSHLEMANAYQDIREKGDVILVKGSRGLRMERVVDELKDRE